MYETRFIPGNIYLSKVNNRNTRKSYEICSKLRIETPERRQLCISYFTSFSNVSIADFEHINVTWDTTWRDNLEQKFRRIRDVLRTCQTSKMVSFSKIVNGFSPLNILAKRSIWESSTCWALKYLQNVLIAAFMGFTILENLAFNVLYLMIKYSAICGMNYW